MSDLLDASESVEPQDGTRLKTPDNWEDPRIIRSRELLKGALSRLVQTKPFDKITVNDITREARVNRSTFYSHYDNKLELLGETIADGFRLFKVSDERFRDTEPEQTVFNLIMTARDYLFDNREISMLALKELRTSPYMSKPYNELLGSVVLWQTDLAPEFIVPVKLRPVIARIIVDGSVGVFISWLQRPFPATDEEVAAVSKLIVSSLMPYRAG